VNRRAALAVIASLALTGAWATWFWWRLPQRLPTDDDYRRANELIASKAQPGDVIVLAPSWAERGRQFFTAAPVEAGYDLETSEFPGTKRQWLVALADAPRFDLGAARRTLASRGPSIEYLSIGALWLEVFAIPGPAVTFSATESLARATVTIAGPRGETCRHVEPTKHQCSHADWNHVRAGWYEVQERPMRCVWAHPVDEGPLEVAFDDVPLRGAVQVRAAFVGQSSAFARGAHVELAVRSGDVVAGRVRVENRAGIQRGAVTLPASLPERGPLTLSITTPSSAMRHFCFDAWVGP
jgi:hypothetical protein